MREPQREQDSPWSASSSSVSTQLGPNELITSGLKRAVHSGQLAGTKRLSSSGGNEDRVHLVESTSWEVPQFQQKGDWRRGCSISLVLKLTRKSLFIFSGCPMPPCLSSKRDNMAATVHSNPCRPGTGPLTSQLHCCVLEKVLGAIAALLFCSHLNFFIRFVSFLLRFFRFSWLIQKCQFALSAA